MTSSTKMKRSALFVTVLLTVTHAGKVAVLKDPTPPASLGLTCGSVGVITNFDHFIQDLYNPLYATPAGCAAACAAYNTTPARCVSFNVRSGVRGPFCELHSNIQRFAGIVGGNAGDRDASMYQGFDLECFNFVEAPVDQTSNAQDITPSPGIIGRSTTSSSSPAFEGFSISQQSSSSESATTISVTSPATLASSSISSASLTPHVCHEDNCHRAFLRFEDEARGFCSDYTVSGSQTTAPAYLENCEGNPSMLSSGCRCLATHVSPKSPASSPAIQTSASSGAQSSDSSTPTSTMSVSGLTVTASLPTITSAPRTRTLRKVFRSKKPKKSSSKKFRRKSSSSSSTMTSSGPIESLPSLIPSVLNSSSIHTSSMTASFPPVKAFPPINWRPLMNSTRPEVTGFLNATSSGLANSTMTASLPPVIAFPPTNWRPLTNSTKPEVSNSVNSTSSLSSDVAPLANITRSLTNHSIANATWNGFLSNFGATPTASTTSPNSTIQVDPTKTPQSTSISTPDEVIFEPVHVITALASDMVGVITPVELQGIAVPIELQGITVPVAKNKTTITLARRVYDHEAVKALNLPSGFEGCPEATPYVKSVISLVTITTASGGQTKTLVFPTDNLPPPPCGLSLNAFMYPEEAYHAYCPEYTSTTSAEETATTTSTTTEEEEEITPVTTYGNSMVTITMTNFGQVSTLTRSSDDLPPPPCGGNLDDFTNKEEAYRAECPGYVSTTTAQPKITDAPMIGRAVVNEEKTSHGGSRINLTDGTIGCSFMFMAIWMVIGASLPLWTLS
ncbi:hypothetical protein VTL71DRAFT_7765 [Oculimacula yallundae]|uniref:Apple domain-containing protein n=1 Tax=Oculimacula yallundae TaxID=86028 RepID=A0ABR4CVW9_9HELO